MIGNFPAVWTSTAYFSNSTGSSITNCRFSPIIDYIWKALSNNKRRRRTPVTDGAPSSNLCLHTIPKFKSNLGDTVSKWALTCGGNCLWGYYRFDLFIKSLQLWPQRRWQWVKAIYVILICIWHWLFLCTSVTVTVGYPISNYFYVMIIHFGW